jgi:hypothetical protein
MIARGRSTRTTLIEPEGKMEVTVEEWDWKCLQLRKAFTFQL